MRGCAVENRREHLIELIRRHCAFDGRFPVDQLLLHHVAGEVDRGDTGSFAVAGLQHENLAVLDGELEVLHILEMRFEDLPDAFELRERLGQMFLEIRDRFGRAHSGDNVFALRVDEEFPVKNFFAGRRVARESDPGTGVRSGIAEHHGLHVHGRAPFLRDIVFPAINDRAVVHPGAENGADRAFELLPRICSGIACRCAP